MHFSPLAQGLSSEQRDELELQCTVVKERNKRHPAKTRYFFNIASSMRFNDGIQRIGNLVVNTFIYRDICNRSRVPWECRKVRGLARKRRKRERLPRVYENYGFDRL